MQSKFLIFSIKIGNFSKKSKYAKSFYSRSSYCLQLEDSDYNIPYNAPLGCTQLTPYDNYSVPILRQNSSFNFTKENNDTSRRRNSLHPLDLVNNSRYENNEGIEDNKCNYDNEDLSITEQEISRKNSKVSLSSERNSINDKSPNSYYRNENKNPRKKSNNERNS